jgi:hypothetical protein
MIAVNCGTPIPAITLVVQMEPGRSPLSRHQLPRLLKTGGFGGGYVPSDHIHTQLVFDLF